MDVIITNGDDLSVLNYGYFLVTLPFLQGYHAEEFVEQEIIPVQQTIPIDILLCFETKPVFKYLRQQAQQNNKYIIHAGLAGLHIHG